MQGRSWARDSIRQMAILLVVHVVEAVRLCVVSAQIVARSDGQVIVRPIHRRHTSAGYAEKNEYRTDPTGINSTASCGRQPALHVSENQSSTNHAEPRKGGYSRRSENAVARSVTIRPYQDKNHGHKTHDLPASITRHTKRRHETPKTTKSTRMYTSVHKQ